MYNDLAFNWASALKSLLLTRRLCTILWLILRIGVWPNKMLAPISS